MFEQHPPLLCRNVIPEGKGIIFTSRLLTRLDFSPHPEGRLWAPGVWGATPQSGQWTGQTGAGVIPCLDRCVTHVRALLVTRVTSPHTAPRGATKSLKNKQREEQV